ncbi:MAG: hypothetical protein LC657_08525 [Desulfobacteraceae bacterium]|nr:hypothetical protein [Desulfobacteraceae bacterium]
MKRHGGGVVRKNQKKWLTNLAQQGYYVVGCKGSDAALRVLKGYIGLEKDQILTF